MNRNNVDSPAFWKKRIETAAKKQYSVYVCNDTTWGVIERDHSKTLKKLIPETAKVLDAGCGYGRMAKLFKPENYLGVDFSPEFIQLAQEENPDYKFEVANLQRLPYDDQEFDWVFCISIKHMIQSYSKIDWQIMEDELKRVGKKVLLLEYTDSTGYEII